MRGQGRAIRRRRTRTAARVLAALSLGLSNLYAREGASPAGAALLLPKILSAALAPAVGLAGVLGALLGLVTRAPAATIGGALGALAAARHVRQVIAPHRGFEAAFGSGWQHWIPPARRAAMLQRRWQPWLPGSPEPRWERDVPYHTVPGPGQGEGRRLLCDLWLPGEGVRSSGLVVVHMHGSAWHVGDKDMGTRLHFRHLAAQGHAVMDIAYRLCPEVGILGMVSDVLHAITWIKAHAPQYGIDPERVVLGGGSAGGQLALLVGYAAGHPALTPAELSDADISVRGVYAYYGAVDMCAVREHAARVLLDKPQRSTQVAILTAGFLLGDVVKGLDWRTFSAATMVGNPMGGTPEEVPEMYALASPLTHVRPGCPPTLLLQGEHDTVMPPRAARALHRALVAAGVPAVCVFLPETSHGFDLILPRVSPSAQAALYDLERFLALVAQPEAGVKA
ncbi:MAG: alpha/beta hydrolase [Anaerolineae bacterium]|nr:alpha/beta hydrolase [Anaerolineae bacterium]